MRFFYLLIGIIGVILTIYGFNGIIDPRIKKNSLRAFLMLIGILMMIFGLLLYGVPHFFSSE